MSLTQASLGHGFEDTEHITYMVQFMNWPPQLIDPFTSFQFLWLFYSVILGSIQHFLLSINIVPITLLSATQCPSQFPMSSYEKWKYVCLALQLSLVFSS